VIGFVSTGSSAFPGASGCFGYIASGTIRYTREASGKLTSRIVFVARLQSPLGWKGDCSEFAFDKTIVLNSKNIGDLTPWDGAVGSHIYKETNP